MDGEQHARLWLGEGVSGEPDALDNADEQKSESRKSRAGNPKFVRGPYYEALKKCLSSQAKVLEKNEKNLRDWFNELGRREFREDVGIEVMNVSQIGQYGPNFFLRC